MVVTFVVIALYAFRMNCMRSSADEAVHLHG